jgi:toxin ParE1/3/4
MSKTFKITEKADHDLDEIYLYSLEHFGSIRAEQYILELVDVFQQLVDGIKKGIDCSTVKQGLYAAGAVSHIVYYKKTKHGIIIYRVLHKSMDYQNHF